MDLRLTITAGALALCFGLSPAQAQTQDRDAIVKDAPPGWNGEGRIVTPPSSLPAGPGREHTNTQIFVPQFDQPKGEQPGEREPKKQQPR